MTCRSFRMSQKPKMESTMKSADPSETRAWVLIPAAHSSRSRSRPTRAPGIAATARRKTSSSKGLSSARALLVRDLLHYLLLYISLK